MTKEKKPIDDFLEFDGTEIDEIESFEVDEGDFNLDKDSYTE